MGFTAPRQLAQAPINAYRSFAYANSYTLISLLIPDGINEFFFMLFFFSIMFANSKMISGFCVPFFMQEIMGELGTPVIPLSQIIKTTKGTNQFECGAQRHGLSKGLSLFLFLPPPPPTFSLFICSFPLTRDDSQRHLGRQVADLLIQNINSLPPSTPITTSSTGKMMCFHLKAFGCPSRLGFKAQTAVEGGKNRTF